MQRKSENLLSLTNLFRCTIYILLFFFMLSFSACKKCIVCSNICYQCTSTVGNICSTDFPTQAAFDTIISYERGSGDTCSLVQSTKSTDVCGGPTDLNNFKNLYQAEGYTCTNK